MKIFENIVLLIGLITCLSGAWMRRKEDSRSRGTKLLWLGFSLMLFGLFVHSDYGQGFIEGWLERKPKP
jgi:hypothetical protein